MMAAFPIGQHYRELTRRSDHSQRKIYAIHCNVIKSEASYQNCIKAAAKNGYGLTIVKCKKKHVIRKKPTPAFVRGVDTMTIFIKKVAMK
jgi:hypothetical protein